MKRRVNALERALSIAALVVLGGIWLTGCGCLPERDKSAEEAQDRYERARTICPAMADVQKDFGATLGGTYGGATFLEYTIGGSVGAPAISPPNSSVCAQAIASRLQTACGLCQNQPGECLNLVSGFFSTPSSSCTFCGDAVCSVGEELSTCPADCLCGNGTCDIFADPPETPLTCTADCGGTCGDRYCAEPLEQCSCDGVDGECVECVEDCCVAVCGDGQCDVERGEAELDGAGYCEVDCGGGSCGDDICQPTENPATCPLDCERFTDCGDGVCAFPETCANCKQDCNVVSGSAARCLDGICSVCEVVSCQTDCVVADDFDCGDGVCDGAEHPANCPEDCAWEDCNSVEGGFECPNERCGDGICGQTESSECADCTGACLPRAVQPPVCVANERYCGHQVVDGSYKDVILDCADPIEGCPERPNVIVCEGRCRPTADGAVCVDCPPYDTPTDPQLILCSEPFEPFCTSETRVRSCVVDPAYSDDPACGVLREAGCPTGCVDGVCTGPGLITGLSPSPAREGDTVNVWGANFAVETGTVTFPGELSATIVSWEDNRLQVVVPAGTSSGVVTVTKANMLTATADFVLGVDPAVLGVYPPGGTAGDTATLTGFLFGEVEGTVSFEPGMDATIVSWSDERIEAIVPEGAFSGLITVTGPGQAWTAMSPRFEVDTLPLILTGVSPDRGRAGDEVTFTGRYFADDVEVYFMGSTTPAPVVSASYDTLTVTIPADARTGNFELRRFNQGYGNADIFTVLPSVQEIVSCGEDSAAPGDQIVLVGSVLEGVAVSFTPDVPAVVLPGSLLTPIPGFDQLIAIVPPGARTGPLTLTLEGDAYETAPFTIRTPDADTRQAQWPMPDSATATCVVDGAVADCPGMGEPSFGQDGNTTDPAPSFTSEDPIVTDDVTGLSFVEEVGTRGWLDAQCLCKGGAWGGFEDWRLPTAVEMISVYDAGARDVQGVPALPGGQSFRWTNELYVGDPTRAWVTTQGVTDRWLLINEAYPNLCVRSTTTAPTGARYTTTADTVRDTRTDLMWQRRPTFVDSWTDALAACAALDVDGFDDWRLPNVKETLTLVDRSAANPSIDTTAFEMVGASTVLYTSSVPSDGGATRVLVEMGAGRVTTTAVAPPTFMCVRRAPE